MKSNLSLDGHYDNDEVKASDHHALKVYGDQVSGHKFIFWD